MAICDPNLQPIADGAFTLFGCVLKCIRNGSLSNSTPFEDDSESVVNSKISSHLKTLESVHANGSSSDMCFYRVYYHYSQSRSSLFNARTPVYTSSYVSHGDEMTWTESDKFRLDISRGGLSSFGDIVISFYKTRAKGGNELIGELKFPLRTIYESGTSISLSGSSEGRSVEGSYSIQSKDSSYLATIACELLWIRGSDIESRGDNIIQQLRRSPEQILADENAISAGRDNPGLDNKTAAKSIESDDDDVKPEAKTNLGFKANRLNSTKHAMRKISSSRTRKKMEDDRRIERENNIIHRRLMKLETSSKKSKVDAIRPYGPPGGGVDVSKQTKDVMTADKKSDDRKENDAKKEVSPITDKDLLDKVNQMKRKIVDLRNENDALKAQNNKFKTHISKYSKTTKRNNVNNLNGPQRDDTSIDLDESRDTDAVENDHVGINICTIVKNTVSRNDVGSIYEKYGLNERDIKDSELVDVVNEHFYLRNIIRNSMYRKEINRQFASQTSQLSNDIDKQNIGIVTKLRRWFPDRVSIVEKFLPTSYESIDNINTNEEKADKEVYDRYMASKSRYDNLIALNDHDIHSTFDVSKTFEYKAIYERFVKLKEELMSDTSLYETKRRTLEDQFKEMAVSGTFASLREKLISLKRKHLKMNREKNMSDLLGYLTI